MDVLVGAISLTIVLLFCGLSQCTRPYELRPRLLRWRPQFGLRTLFLITCLCAGLCGWLQSTHVVADVTILTLCWTICGFIGATEGPSSRGIGVWRGAAFAGGVGGAAGGLTFAVAILVLGRPSFALAGELRQAWPHIACLLIWGSCIGTLIGCSISGLRIIDRRALLSWSLSSAASPETVAEHLEIRSPRMSTFVGWRSVLFASVASALIHFAAIHSPPIPLPGELSKVRGIEADLEIVLDAVPIRSHLQPAVQLASYNTFSPPDDFRPIEPMLPSALVIPPSPQEKLRVARERAGVNAPVCLDGYCPVDLVKTARWIKGDATIPAVYQGRTYQFASEQAKRAFWERPDRYAPAISGYDPVLLLDDNRLKRKCPSTHDLCRWAAGKSGEDRTRTLAENGGKTGITDQDGAKYGALSADSNEGDSDLHMVIKAWPDLSDNLRARIVSIIGAQANDNI